MEFGLLAAAVASLAAAWIMLRVTDGSRLFDTVLTATIVGLLVGRVGAMALAGTNPVTRPLDIIIVRGGVDTAFASAAAVGFFAWAMRRDLWASADTAAPAIVAALATWHAGCLTSGSCLGTPSTLPWAWTATDGGVARHPTELYAALALAVVAGGLLLGRRWLARRPGSAAAVGVLGVALVRLLTEPLRVTIGGGPWWWYGTGALVGGVLLVWRTTADPSRHRIAP